MKFAKNKTMAITIALILMTSMFAATFITCLPTANAKVVVAAYLSVHPTTIGIGQILLVNMWLSPVYLSGGLNGTIGYFEGYVVTFTKPDGTTEAIGPMKSELSATAWFDYVPDQLGTWSANFYFPGDALHYNATSQNVTFTVQQEPVPLIVPQNPLPTDYWTSPINAENREWYRINGPWLQSGYDALGNKYNPYSTGPNSAHILWRDQVSIGGLVGGIDNMLYSLSAPAGGGASPIIMFGREYYNIPNNQFCCVDIRTGEVLWNQSGSITVGQITRTYTAGLATAVINEESAAGTPYLWGFGSTAWTRYNAFDGSVSLTLTGVPSWGAGGIHWMGDENGTAYIRQLPGGANFVVPTMSQLIMWNLTKVSGTNWLSGVQWNVSVPYDAPGGGGGGNVPMVYGNICLIAGAGSSVMYAYDTNTGKLLWRVDAGFYESVVTTCAYGKYMAFNPVDRIFYCYEMSTGNLLYTTPAMDWPWGSFLGGGRAWAYGNFYEAGYRDAYCFNGTTGKIIWMTPAENNTDMPPGNLQFWYSWVFADGKYYQYTSEHTPSQPRPQGNKLYCFDAFTGKVLWTEDGAIAVSAIAEGYLLGTNEYDGYQYCIGKGPTAITVSATPEVSVNGESVMVQGTVTDQSPSAKGTPAIADASMSDWMGYLYMQKPMPTNATGVPVSIDAVDPNGNLIHIGNATSDTSGLYSYEWTTPNVPGSYTVIATFAGSESYWSSHVETAIGVNEAPAPTAAPTPTPQSVADMYFVPAVVAIIVVIIIGFVLLFLALRKRP
jgi:outer membrane protein assembly factor BamB